MIDECHNFLNLPYSIDDLLAEARGLRLSLTLAHQNLAQLPPELRAGITANARNKIIFTVGADDARDLARHTQPAPRRLRPGPPRRLPRRRPPGRPRRPHPRVHPAHPPAAATAAAPSAAPRRRHAAPPPARRSATPMTTPRPRPRRPGRAAARGSPRRQRGHRDPLTAARPLRPVLRPPPRRPRHPAHRPRPVAARDAARTPRPDHPRHRPHGLHLRPPRPPPAAATAPLGRAGTLRPRLPVGAAPLHYVLGPAGAAVLAAHHGLPLPRCGYRRDDALAIAHHHTLAHTVAVNDLFAHLVHHTLQPAPSPGSVGWTAGGPRPAAVASSTTSGPTPTPASPPHPHRHSAPTPAPTGWCSSGSSSSTSPPATLDTLAAKLDRYARLAAATRPRPLLIWLPTPAREAHARTRLTHARDGIDPRLLPIATSTAAIAALPDPTAATGRRHRPQHDAEQPGSRRSGRPTRSGYRWAAADGVGRVDLAALARLWPAPPGTTLAEETGIPDDASTPTPTPSLTPRTSGHEPSVRRVRSRRTWPVPWPPHGRR